MSMHVGNGALFSAKAVGVYTLHLPSGFTIELDNCYYVPAICKNIMSGSCLLRDGYSFKSENKGCSIYMNEMFYGFAPLVGGLFILDLDNRNDILNVEAKCIKLSDENTTMLWH